MKHRAVFLDRDGTLVHPRHYPSRPADLRLYDGIGPGLRDLRRAGFQLVVITNQAGVARGYFTEADLERMHEHLARELEQLGVELDAIYYCPHHPEGVIPELAVRCDCRKPQPGMLLRAATDLDLDLQSSWFVGDILDDVEAGNRAGCRTILVDLGHMLDESAFYGGVPISTCLINRPHDKSVGYSTGGQGLRARLPGQQIRCPDFVARDTLHALRIISACEHLGPPSERPNARTSWQHEYEQCD